MFKLSLFLPYYLFTYYITYYKLSCIIGDVLAFEMIPERPNTTFVNYKYVKWANITVVRYGRRSLYYFNIEGETRHTWGNNVTVNLVFYEFLSNEYRRSFVEFHFPLCKLVGEEMYIGGMLAKALSGRTCPYPAGEYHLMNMTVPSPKIKYVWPFRRARIDVYVQRKPNNDTIAAGFIFVTIK